MRVYTFILSATHTPMRMELSKLLRLAAAVRVCVCMRVYLSARIQNSESRNPESNPRHQPAAAKHLNLNTLSVCW